MKWLKLRLPDTLREELKKPLGELIIGNEDYTYHKISSFIRKYAPTTIVTVGDRISHFLNEYGIKVDVIIIDHKEKRKPYQSTSGIVSKNIIKVSNQPGYIESGAWKAVSQALKLGETIITIDGEEDLLVLVVASLAPTKTLIFYGQPDVGVVIVKVTDEFKRYIKEEILDKMIVE
jgi:uncharacterized protein (UPF0218 family)